MRVSDYFHATALAPLDPKLIGVHCPQLRGVSSIFIP